MPDTNTNSMDAPTVALATIMIAAVVLAAVLGLTGVGVVGMLVTIAICRFFGRPHLGIVLFPLAIAILAFSLSHGVGYEIWAIAFKAYWQTIRLGTFPAVTAMIWVDPTQIYLDEMTLGAVGIILGGVFELLSDGRRNSRIAMLMAAGSQPTMRRAPIAYLCEWLAPRRKAASKRGTLLGTEIRLGTSLYLTEAMQNHQSMVIGSTGTGKTTALTNLISSAAQQRQPCVYLDGKGDEEFAEVVRRIAASFDRPFYIFSMLSPELSCAYSALACGDYTSKSDRIMNWREWTEPHYESLAAPFLQTAFKILEFENIVVDIVQAGKALSIAHLVGLLRRKGFSNAEKQALANEISGQAVAEATAISSLKSDIQYIANSSLGPLFDTVKAAKDGRPILNLEQARNEGAVVYFCLSPLLFQKAADKISKLIINDLKAVTATSRSTYKLFFDEALFTTPESLNLVNMGRTFGVAATFSSQSLADYQAGSPMLGDAFVRQFLASTNNFIIFRVNEPDEAETIGRLIGTMPNVELTAQTEGEKPTGAASARMVREFAVHPDILKTLGRGEAIVVNKNNGRTTKIKVRKSRI